MSDTTHMLICAAQGDPSAAANLFPLVYDELHARAVRYFSEKREAQTLQPTAVVNEAFLKLIRSDAVSWRDRQHFLAIASRAMRQIIADSARRRRALKRDPPGSMVTLADVETPGGVRPVDLLALDEALTKLEEINPRHSRMVELRFFGGLSVEELAQTLNLSESAVAKEWRAVRAWLSVQLSDGTAE